MLERISMFDIKNLLNVPSTNMGDIYSSEYNGIFIPTQDIKSNKVGLTSQFLDNANLYHEKYINTDYFEELIGNALKVAEFKCDSPLILDIGSGSGNSVFPCLDLLPKCNVLVTDLSHNLLCIMKKYADTKAEYRERLQYVCMDACGDYILPGIFDLVVGAAILHHLIDPFLAFKSVIRALRPGGVAIFFEPFENGNSILRLAYTQIVSNSKARDQLSPEIMNLLLAFVRDYEIRTGTDKSNSKYLEIDDKWLFTRSYIEDCAARCGYSYLHVYPIHPTDTPFKRQTVTNLKLGLGCDESVLPNWAWDIIDYYDNFFSNSLKKDLLIEGAIVLRH